MATALKEVMIVGIEEGEPIEKSPYNIIFDLAQNLKEAGATLPKAQLINHSYQDWAEGISHRGAIVARPSPLRETLERHLFGVFCEQIRVLGAEVSQEEEAEAFNELLQD